MRQIRITIDEMDGTTVLRSTTRMGCEIGECLALVLKDHPVNLDYCLSEVCRILKDETGKDFTVDGLIKELNEAQRAAQWIMAKAAFVNSEVTDLQQRWPWLKG